MIIELLINWLIASGTSTKSGHCFGTPVARDAILAPGNCAENFRTGIVVVNGETYVIEGLGRDYPEYNMSLFLLKTRLPRSIRIPELREDDGLEKDLRVDLGPIKNLTADDFELESTYQPATLLKNGQLVGLHKDSGGYLRVSTQVPWINLKVGGD